MASDADRADLEQFCRDQHPRLVAMLSLYCGEPAIAEDLAQETLERVCASWPKVRGMDDPAAWTWRVARNLAHSTFRRRAAARRALERVESRTRQPEPPDVVTAMQLRAALGRLPARQREALVLRYLDDRSLVDTASAMRCAEGTVKALSSQGLAALRAAEHKETTDVR
jgi:RNA polymerase sigma factor (sigma-70 family)